MNVIHNPFYLSLNAIPHASLAAEGRWRSYVIKTLDENASSSLFRHPILASAGVVFLNIAFVQVALKICQIAYHLFIHFPEETYSINRKSTALVGLFSLSLIGFNWLAKKGLNIPLSPLATTVLSLTTIAASLFFIYRNRV